MNTLREHPWRISYSSDTSNPVADFYIPALECAIQYDRKSGFFNSAILSKVARGLGAMLHNQGQMRLIMGCQFSPEDLQAIRQGYELREALTQSLGTHLVPPTNFTQLKHFEILGWLIQNQTLDIRIAIPLQSDGTPEDPTTQLDTHHLFHEKVGIFTDANADQLAFNGSNNESVNGWQTNIESFHVFCAWEGGRDLERVQEEISRFERLWDNQLPNVRVFEVPEAIQKKLLRYAPTTKPTWERAQEYDSRPIPKDKLPQPDEEPAPPEPPSISSEQAEQERQSFQPLTTLHHHPGCLDFVLNSIPIKPWPHQIKILRRIAQEFPRNALIADEVGLGKTIETGLVLRYLLVSRKVKRILILAPASVQPQWQDELREKFNLHFWSYIQGGLRDSYKQTHPLSSNPWNSQDLILASSHLIRRQERMQELLEAEPWDLVVLDEATTPAARAPRTVRRHPTASSS